MKRTVQLFIEGERVELFNDEQISINLSVQNLTDLSKTFTDFTQSFQVPASPGNNKIFKHFYTSAISFFDGPNTINPNLRRFSILEIDNTFFRRGSVSLEKANIKNNQPYSYTITFYGDLVSLKDTFGETRLMDLDWSTIDYPYTLQSIRDRIEDATTDYDVRYPLISSERYWQYNNPQTPTENIDTVGGAINITELFPAVKNKAILEVIEANFNITFQGNFLQDERFTNSYLLFKNAVTFGYQTPPKPLVFTEVKRGVTVVAPPFPYVFDYGLNAVNGATLTISDVDNSIALQYVTYEFEEQIPFPPPPQVIDSGFHVVEANIGSLSSDAIIYVDVYTAPGNSTNYTFNNTVEIENVFPGSVNQDIYILENTNNPSIDLKVRFETRTSAPINYNINLDYRFSALNTISLGAPLKIICQGPSTTQNVDISALAPNMTVEKYFSNLLKAWNLTAYGISRDNYEIQTVENWYNEGAITDITEFVDMKQIDIARLKLFNKINFKYAECKSLTNRFFANSFLREYGDLYQTFNYDGGDYNIELEFENLLFSRFENTNLQVGYCIDEGLKPYIPNPILLYTYETQTCSFYLTNGTTDVQINQYVPFGQDTQITNENYNLNWGTENSSLIGNEESNNLYQTYYKAYLDNLYNPKNRQLTVKAILPLSIITGVKLNDRLTIRSERYIVNNIKLNLTSGEATLTLIQDFRRMIADGLPPIFPPIKPDQDAQCVDVPIPFPNGAVSATITTTFPGVTITPSTITEPQRVEVCIPANPNSTNYLVTEVVPISQIQTENNESFVLENSEGEQTIILTITWTYANGDQVSNQIYIQQQ